MAIVYNQRKKEIHKTYSGFVIVVTLKERDFGIIKIFHNIFIVNYLVFKNTVSFHLKYFKPKGNIRLFGSYVKHRAKEDICGVIYIF